MDRSRLTPYDEGANTFRLLQVAVSVGFAEISPDFMAIDDTAFALDGTTRLGRNR